MSNKIIGIDLGTTNSVVAVIESGQPTIIINEEGERTTPSVVAFKDGDRLVGKAARNQAVTNPKNTVFSIKRFMGQRWEECKAEASTVPYEVVRAAGDIPKVKIDSDLFSPPEISAMVLQKLKRSAERYLNEEVTEAVITVPAYFNDSQRQATKDAGRIAGLEVKRIINEPTAAALAYGLNKDQEQRVAVYDFGGGTFDISILEISEGLVEVLSTNGDTHLGGDDVDQVLIEWIFGEFKKEHKIDLLAQAGSEMSQQRVRQAAEEAKKNLSSAPSANISLPFLYHDASGPKNLELSLTRAQFERMITPVIERTLEPCRLALKDAGIKANQVDEVLLVGGSTRIPLVQEKVTKLFGKEPNRTVNPDEVVALGAAIQGGIMTKDIKDLLLLDVTPLSLGLETLGGVCTIQIPRNTTIPAKKSEVFSTAMDNQTAVDIQVFQGERKFAKDNRLLGNFRLEGIEMAPRGMPQIEVTFDIDANGLLTVSAKDKKTGQEQEITIKSSGGLSEDEINRMRDEAEANAADDEEKFKLIEARNKLDNEIYQFEKMLNENKDNLPPEVAGELEQAITSATEAKDSDDLDAMEAASAALMETAQRFQQMASAAGAAGPQAQAAPSDAAAGGEDDIIDVTPEA